MKPLQILKNAADLIVSKGNDYQNPKSRIRQADYYPNGAQTILDIIRFFNIRNEFVYNYYNNYFDESDLKIIFNDLKKLELRIRCYAR